MNSVDAFNIPVCVHGQVGTHGAVFLFSELSPYSPSSFHFGSSRSILPTIEIQQLKPVIKIIITYLPTVHCTEPTVCSQEMT